MKHLSKFNEKMWLGEEIKTTQELIDGVNDICEELNDDGFYSVDDDDNNIKVEVINNSYIRFSKNHSFHFSEISDVIYRIKDFTGIDKIESLTFIYYHVVGYTRCDMNKLNNETLNIKNPIIGGFIYFNFQQIRK